MVRLIAPIVGLLIGLGFASESWAEDWPQYRGPKRDGVSRETGLLKVWPKEGPKLLWTYRDAGAGFSPPSIVGNHFYCMGSKDKDDVVFALDTQTGKLIWTASAGPRRLTDWGDGPCSTPTVDGDYLYVVSILGELHCINRRTGENVWHVHLKSDLHGKIIHDGRYCESPLVDGNRVVCCPGNKGGTFAAFDKLTGKLLWRSTDLTDEAVSSSVIVAEIDGLRQYVNLTGKGVAGVAAEDGRLLWKSSIPAAWIMVATPILHEDSIYVTTAYGVGCGLLKLKREDKGIKTEVVYRNKVMKNHHSGVTLVNGLLFGCSDPNGWVCQDFKTGKLVWEEKFRFDKGSFAYADGHLYCYGESKGDVALVEASGEGWFEKSRFTIPELTKIRRKNGKIWTPPVISHGRLYLRDNDLVFCYNIAPERK
jgi:outer membrane protein assembly factor BamB